ncbi:MAG: hypothetical protein COW00_10860 [Bdellovibrio sp. CG12_big_fil_rev_8_21_14_0_65_39_13]|nr:MAG: hypothetical protein COW78_03815 [Bdellovibrio sp. CG22_combo_CG10-13_8_21_14_all_39_27]PIQ59379.1 MAG: hypothetical protein COW00_10860 [Bdellovibrio sp. CG12_big_fil_rev_8_21_14_0_65_39_13]PIR35722.1 MAG: hypothetical protein COV37_07115 [Bdellovibrio sp. CG11_big_fil_rev_8_21_14_0_20_39_38]
MFTIDSTHFLSLVCAFLFAILAHLSFSGFFKNTYYKMISFALFPVLLMASSLIFPQFILQGFAYLIFLLGLILFFYKTPQHLLHFKNLKNQNSKKEKLIFFFIIIYLLSFFMSSTELGGVGLIQDALVYHIEGPKEWALYLNGAKFNPNNPISYTTSYYDYYYYFLFLIVKPFFLATSKLATTQYEFLSYTFLLTAQIFTAVLGYVYIPYLILRMASNFGHYKYLILIFVFSIRDITWSWPLPKNDAFPFFCFLLALEIFYHNYILKKNNPSVKWLLLSATLIGIGCGSKLTNSYVVIFSLLFYALFYFKDAMSRVREIKLTKSIFIACAGMLLGVSIFLIRNWIQTGNPFYPIAKFGFPDVYLTKYAARPELYILPGTWDMALTKIKLHIISQPQLWLLLVAAFIAKIRLLPLFYIFSVTYMAKQTGPMYSFRMTSILLILLLIIIIMLVQRIYQLQDIKKKKIFSILLIFFVLIYGKLQVEKMVKIPYRTYSKPIATLLESNLHQWDELLKNNLENRENPHYVYWTSENIFPYFSRYPVISTLDSVPEKRVEYFKE